MLLYHKMTSAYFIALQAALCQAKLLWDLQKKELVPQHETLKAYSVVINMTAAMLVSTMTAVRPSSPPRFIASVIIISYVSFAHLVHLFGSCKTSRRSCRESSAAWVVGR